MCVTCGINLKTGRPILMTGEDADVDLVYERTEKILRPVSWLVSLGLYPVASEAFGLRKPWVVRGIAILTITISLWFLGVLIAEGRNPSTSHLNLMLWAGRQAPEATNETAADSLRESDREAQDGVEPTYRPQAPPAQPAGPQPPRSRRTRPAPPSLDMEAADPGPAEFARLGVRFHWYQLLTHAFLHGGLFHLAGNLLFLFVLGSRVNALIGNMLSLIVYPVLAILASVTYLIAMSSAPLHPMIGASGAIMGLSGMYLVLFPVHKVHMAAWIRWWFRFGLKIFVVRGFWVPLFYIAFDVVYTIARLEDGVAHWAHLGGFIAGIVIALLLLCTRLVNARGGDLLTALLGRHAWALIGKPNRPGRTFW